MKYKVTFDPIFVHLDEDEEIDDATIANKAFESLENDGMANVLFVSDYEEVNDNQNK